ncbi:hypothetical protein EYC84_011959 [Monilinia fructicola]|uniref:Uncharacterized protein n=1 Tax=Monilinia fructicola TaxID=38448 RepID=A0A5M9J8I4_MONFR|nr:hypothetical protein EYC84_011959 [Monilinia fructicola]
MYPNQKDDEMPQIASRVPHAFLNSQRESHNNVKDLQSPQPLFRMPPRSNSEGYPAPCSSTSASRHNYHPSSDLPSAPPPPEHPRYPPPPQHLPLAILPRKRTRSRQIPMTIANLERIPIHPPHPLILNPLFPIDHLERSTGLQDLGRILHNRLRIPNGLVQLRRTHESRVRFLELRLRQRTQRTRAVELEELAELGFPRRGGPAHVIGGGDFLAGEDFAHGVHEEFLALGVPGVLGCGEAGVVDAGNGLEDAADGGVRAEGVRVGADDVGERGALAGVIVVEGEVCALGFFREGAEEAGEVFFDGVGVVEAFGCEEGFFVEEEGSWGDYAGCEDALALFRGWV